MHVYIYKLYNYIIHIIYTHIIPISILVSVRFHYQVNTYIKLPMIRRNAFGQYYKNGPSYKLLGWRRRQRLGNAAPFLGDF